MAREREAPGELPAAPPHAREHGPVDELDFASRLPCYGSKVGIDATRKWKGEGFERPWPPEIRMSEEVRKRVDALWPGLGIKLPGGG